VRGNRFIDNWHAISINGHTVHVVDNHFSVPQPERVPDYGYAWDAIKIAPPMPIQGATGPPACIGNVVAGNTIEGYIDGVRLEVYLPGSICRENVIRDNTITVRRAHNPSHNDPSDPTVIGTPIALLNDPIFSEYAGSDAPALVEANIVPLVPSWRRPPSSSSRMPRLSAARSYALRQTARWARMRRFRQCRS
jgi:hypothetical protein